ncbi:MAG: hypothetical protein ACK4RK_10800 [Gemmataceae bacterium]
MPDNTTINPGFHGDVIATDDIAGVKYPRSKIVLGDDGVNDGDISANNPLPVVVAAALPAGANHIGDVDVVSLPSLPAGTNTIGKVDVATLPALPAGGNAIGKISLQAATAALTAGAVNVSSSGNHTLVSGTFGQTVRVYRLMLVVAEAVTVQFRDGSSSNLTGPLPLQAGGAIILDFDGEPWFTTSSGNGFVLNLSAAVQVSGRIWYLKS